MGHGGWTKILGMWTAHHHQSMRWAALVSWCLLARDTEHCSQCSTTISTSSRQTLQTNLSGLPTDIDLLLAITIGGVAV